MAKSYDHKKIESKWQKEWDKKKIYNASKENDKQSKKPKYYSLIEFPYPSGDGLHVGHPRPYIGMDVISRKKRMEGYNVLYPIGWDAFGLPTENYAIKTGLDPRVVTKKNSDNFRRQIKSIGISFDWSREINTTDSKYYKWTQWIFLQFLKKKLAYKKKMLINWCPKDKIGLANEEVVAGCCERCGTPVEKREKEQWMLAITKYAERLDKDLDTVDFLPHIKLAQKNWIGKSMGAEIDFKVGAHNIKVFTTRPDTIYGATYVVLAPEHELVHKFKPQITNWDKVLQYIVATKAKNEADRTKEGKDKTGVELKGVEAINPATGEPVPVWIADYVLSGYGTGAIMAVPAHDERDYEFAEKFNLPTKYVVASYFYDDKMPLRADKKNVFRNAVKCFVRNPKDNTYLCIEWNKDKGVDWRTVPSGGVEEGEDAILAGRREVQEETGYKNLKFIRYIGAPERVDFFHIPKDENRLALFTGLLFELENEERNEVDGSESAKHSYKWVPEKEVLNFINHGNMFFERILNNNMGPYLGGGVLINSGRFDGQDAEQAKKQIVNFVGGTQKTTFKLRDWVFSRQRYWGEPIPVIHCAKCGIVPVPDKDLPVELPKVKNYQPTDSGESPLANISKWVNVKCPKCNGKAKRETDTMPNWAGSSWYYLRYTDPKNSKEFASKKNLKYWTPVNWYNGGNEHTTLHLLYSRFWHKFLFDLKLVPTSEPYKKRTSHGIILAEGGEKMSKSRGNVINPDDIVSRFGADTLRLYEMFMGPFDQAIAWSEEAIIGPRRFLERVWNLQARVISDTGINAKNETHKVIKKVSEDIENMNFNTAVSALMIYSNTLEKHGEITQEEYEALLKLLSPFAPHITEELWATLGHKETITLSEWPKYDPSKIQDAELKIAIQVNGKVRGEMLVPHDIGEETLKAQAVKIPAVAKHIENQSIKKIIYVKGRLINIVV